MLERGIEGLACVVPGVRQFLISAFDGTSPVAATKIRSPVTNARRSSARRMCRMPRAISFRLVATENSQRRFVFGVP